MILVVGGAGYVGSHMVRLLRERGEPHCVLDNLQKGHRRAVEGSSLIEADLRNADAIRHVFAQNDIDVVMHYAASSLVGESVQRPAEYWQNNVVAMLSLLDTMREFGVSKLVFSSSAAVYGNPESVPIPEDAPKNPTSPYGHTKHAMEMALRGYEQAYGIRSICLRYFNAAGAAPDGVIGEDHRPESHLIPAAIRAAQGLQPPLEIFGTDYPTPDGTCVRDYVHVLDLAEAHWQAIGLLRSGSEGGAFNLGTGIGHSVRQVLNAIQRITELEVPHRESGRRAGDPAILVADPTRAMKNLGWNPQRSTLDQMVADAWRWHRSHPAGYG